MTGRRSARHAILGAVATAVVLVSGCSDTKVVGEYPQTYNPQRGDYYARTGNEKDSIFGPEGLTFGGRSNRQEQGGGGGGGLGVNGFLWRASLDTIAFLPVASADPFGGVIITEWHAMPEAPGERFKMNVYVLGRSLRADGIRVAVFRQVQDETGGWLDAPVAADAAVRIEDAILSRARQLRFAALQQS